MQAARANRHYDVDRRSTTTTKSLRRAGHSVKGRIVASGVPLGRLAREAGVLPCVLSYCLTGRSRRAENQWRIWQAYRRMTGDRITLRRFWGELLSERIAG